MRLVPSLRQPSPRSSSRSPRSSLPCSCRPLQRVLLPVSLQPLLVQCPQPTPLLPLGLRRPRPPVQPASWVLEPLPLSRLVLSRLPGPCLRLALALPLPVRGWSLLLLLLAPPWRPGRGPLGWRGPLPAVARFLPIPPSPLRLSSRALPPLTVLPCLWSALRPCLPALPRLCIARRLLPPVGLWMALLAVLTLLPCLACSCLLCLLVRRTCTLRPGTLRPLGPPLLLLLLTGTGSSLQLLSLPRHLAPTCLLLATRWGAHPCLGGRGLPCILPLLWLLLLEGAGSPLARRVLLSARRPPLAGPASGPLCLPATGSARAALVLPCSLARPARLLSAPVWFLAGAATPIRPWQRTHRRRGLTTRLRLLAPRAPPLPLPLLCCLLPVRPGPCVPLCLLAAPSARLARPRKGVATGAAPRGRGVRAL